MCWGLQSSFFTVHKFLNEKKTKENQQNIQKVMRNKETTKSTYPNPTLYGTKQAVNFQTDHPLTI